MVRESFKPKFVGILRADVKGYNRLWIEDGIGTLGNQKAYWGWRSCSLSGQGRGGAKAPRPS